MWTSFYKILSANTLREEPSVIAVLCGASRDSVRAIMDEALAKLHQYSVLVEIDEVKALFYAG